MNLLAKHEQKKSEIERLQAEIEEIERTEEYQQLLDFKGQLEKLMDDYSKAPSDVLRLLDSQVEGQKKAQRKVRSMVTYKNPHTGETVKTKGGNHKTLKAWREEYGTEAVASWKS